ncbi:hypothetical protein COCON_G00230960 [Conger conger]|uniref:Protein phosphatase 1 regulatory subunit n=1 Tax=Conger conger TaxID=82655 RepID=A0A9Q1CV29_CONCO|nr:hypothetical protein COCON_G00230960 [Conger conger]
MTRYCRSSHDVTLFSRAYGQRFQTSPRYYILPPSPRPSALWDSIKYILSSQRDKKPRQEGMKMADAKQKRNEQLKRWQGSETDLEPPVLKKKKTKVKFDDGAVFLAACSSGDTEEVLRMLDRDADINYANVDGLTALHQACIDDNLDMVRFLVEHGAGINQPDNEGWIPLHAAASCGYMDIAEYLLSQGAHVGMVNSEGETPLDIAEEEAMEELLQNEINRQGVDIEAARREEERIMLRDVRQWLNSGQINDVRHTKSGGTALHVAAAKGYSEVLKLLIQAGYDVNIKDFDGWTPLHAAGHWGKEEACRILMENFCDMDALNKVGQTAFDVADEDVLGYLEELQKKQNLLLSERRDVKKSPLIETTGDNNQLLKPLNNKETVVLEPEKPAPRMQPPEPEKQEEKAQEEDGKKDESSCSSEEEEEEEESESENEAEKKKPPATVNSTSGTPPVPVTATVSPPTSPTAPTSPSKKLASPTGKLSPKEEEAGEEEGRNESPASWRTGLRKTGSLAEITAAKEAQREKETAGVMRSASSPRLSSTLENKDKERTRLAYVAPTIPSSRRLASASDADEKENRDSAVSLVRSGLYGRRPWGEETRIGEGTAPRAGRPATSAVQGIAVSVTSQSLAVGRSGSARDVPAKSPSAGSLEPPSNAKPCLPYSPLRSGSFGRRQEETPSSVATSGTSSATSPSSTSPPGSRGLTSSGPSSARSSSSSTPSSVSSRLWSEDSVEKELAAVIPTVVSPASSTTSTTSSTASTLLGPDGRERRRSYLTPVRDEESESRRKARSRQARQSRRSTQGVTLTDLQEAEKTMGRSRPARTQEEEEREKQDKEKQQEEKKEAEAKEEDGRSRYRTAEETYQRYRLSGSSTSATSLSRPNSLTGITSAYSSYGRTPREEEAELDGREEERDGEDRSQPRSIRERRRPREKRRSTGVSFLPQDSDENDLDPLSDTEDQTAPQSDRLTRNDSGLSSRSVAERDRGDGRRPYSSRLERNDPTDYRKLYEQIVGENDKLKAQLRDTDLELAEMKLQLEKATQRQERFADRSQLEMERRERRALERKVTEMEEEIKTLPDLKSDNQRLKDENGALIRVISKLSK